MLRIRALGKSFRQADRLIPVVQDVSFDVGRGEMVALLGANGAGKSTTMRAVSGLLRPVSGTIVLEGVAIERMAAHRIAAAGVVIPTDLVIEGLRGAVQKPIAAEPEPES